MVLMRFGPTLFAGKGQPVFLLVDAKLVGKLQQLVRNMKFNLQIFRTYQMSFH